MAGRLELQERLAATNDQIDHLRKILVKKSLLKSGSIDRSTFTFEGKSLEEYRLKKSSIKAIPKPHQITSDEVPPLPVKAGSKLDQLRRNNLTKALTKWEKEQQNILKQESETIALSKKKQPRKLPKISVPQSMFPNRYIRGELPCTIEHGVKGQYLSWACPLENLDYEYYLPVFFDGIRVKEKPCSFLARQGIEDMLFAAVGNPERIIPSIKGIARPLKNALSLFDAEVLLAVLKALRQVLDVHDSLGEHLLKYAKQFLSPMALFLDQNRNMGDRIDYKQRRNDDIGEEVRLTLELLEEKGGPNALRMIKFSIPVFEGRMRKTTSSPVDYNSLGSTNSF